MKTPGEIIHTRVSGTVCLAFGVVGVLIWAG